MARVRLLDINRNEICIMPGSRCGTVANMILEDLLTGKFERYNIPDEAMYVQAGYLFKIERTPNYTYLSYLHNGNEDMAVHLNDEEKVKEFVRVFYREPSSY